jgi:cysteine dioxygenase
MTLRGAIEELDQSASQMKLPDLRRLIEKFKPSLAEIQPFIHFTDNRYARNLVKKTAQYEVLVLCWRPGQRSPIHDHGNSICAVYTMDGSLSADNYRLTTSGHIRPDYSEDFAPGSVLTIQTSEIHQVSNLQDTGSLVSVHFYLAPLETNLVYSVVEPIHAANRLFYTRVFSFGDGI